MSDDDASNSGGSDAGAEDTGVAAGPVDLSDVMQQGNAEYHEEIKATRLTPTEAGSLKKNFVAILKGHPCKLMDIKVSKTGKHGHAKCNMTGICVLTGKKFNEVKPSHAPMFLARMDKHDYVFSYVKDEVVVCMTESMEEREIKAEQAEIDKITALEGELGADEEILVTVLVAPMQNPEEVVHEVVVGVKKQKAQV